MKCKLACATEQPDPQTRIYRLTGDLHGTSEGYALQDGIRQAVDDGMKRIVLDMSAIERIDSSGVGILVAAMWSASKGGAGMVLAALPERVEKVLGIALLLDHIGHAPSVEEALARLDSMGLPPPAPGSR